MKFTGGLENQEAGKTTLTSRLRKVLLLPLSKGGNNRKKTVLSGQFQTDQKVQATRTVSLSRVVNNTVISLIGQAVTWTSTLLLTIAYGIFLGDVKLGELYFALTFVLLIGFPIEFGFNQQIARDVAQEPAKALRYLSNIILIKLALWLVLYCALLFICRLLGYSQEQYNLVAICGITLLSSSIANAFGSSHYAFERAVFPATGSILEKALSALFGFILLRNGAGVQTMAFVLLGGSLVNAIWQALWFFRLNGLPLSIDFQLIRTLIYTGMPFLIYGVLSVIYYRLDTVLLSLLASTAAVGWYGAGYRIFDTFFFLPSIVINAIMYPVFSKLSLKSNSMLKTAVEKSLNLLIFFAFPICTIMIVDANKLISLLYRNSEFNNTVPSFQGLAPGLIFIYINSVFSSVLMSTKREKKITVMAAIALVFNLGLNIILIPQYQHVGAAIVTSLTEMLLFGLAFFFIPRYLLPSGSISVGAKALIASLAMALISWLLAPYTIFITLPIAMLVYLAVAMFLRTIPQEDIQALYRAVRNKAQKGSAASFVDATTIDMQAALERVTIQSGEIPIVPVCQPIIKLQTNTSKAESSQRQKVLFLQRRQMMMIHILEIISRRLRYLLFILMSLPIIGLIVVGVLPPSYQTTATLWALRSYDTADSTNSVSTLSTSPADTQTAALSELLHSRAFALAVAHETEVVPTLHLSPNVLADSQRRDDALFNEISQHVQVTSLGNNLFQITYTNANPAVAQQVVVAIVKHYAIESQKNSVVATQQLLQTYETQYVKAVQHRDTAAAAESKYLNSHPGLTSAGKSALLADPQYNFLHGQTLQAQTKLDDLHAITLRLNDQIADQIFLQGNGSDSLFRVIDNPEVAKYPVSRTKLFLLAGGIGLGLAILLSALYIAILVRRDRSIYTALDLQRVTSVPTIVEMPTLTSQAASFLIRQSLNKHKREVPVIARVS